MSQYKVISAIGFGESSGEAASQATKVIQRVKVAVKFKGVDASATEVLSTMIRYVVVL